METTRYTPEFRGNGSEFFGIWIVNLVLTVLTLGIYSAWAKVRTERYMYANTRLAGAPFEYLADPIRILKGRLIAYAVLIVFVVAAKLQQFWIVVPIYLALLVLFPYLIHLSLRFRARYSAWRGLRFGFDGRPGQAYTAFMLYPLVAAVTMYLMVPWMVKEQQAYTVKNHHFGGKRFEFGGALGVYYKPFLIALGIGFAIFFVMIIGIFGIAFVGAAAAGGDSGGDPAKHMGVMASVLTFSFIVVLYAGMLALGVYVRTSFINLRWNNTSLGEHRFESTLDWKQMIWIYLSNGLGILVTLGLAVPWAQVRMLRYR
ncbi:MAG: YjgN family protein, partial [Arenimonas sp.]